MKIYKYISIFLAFAMVTGCEDYFGEDANVDPDNPTSATANVILPQVQARLAYVYGGDLARYVSINTQHADGVTRQFEVLGQYGILPSDVDQMWANLYSGTMNSNRRMIQVASENGFNHYHGIGIALETFAIMITTDSWGDVPYSDAFKFAEKGVYQPTFDTQESIYEAIFSNIDQARELLNMDDGGNSPGSADLIYGGDDSAWISFLNVLEARARLHLSEVNGNTAYNNALAALDRGGFASSAGDFDFQFGINANENAPMYQYIEQRDDMEVGSSYVDLLTSLSDPRLAIYGATHDLPHPYYTKDQNLNMLTYVEQEFIRSEALFMTGDSDGAYAAYLEAIRADFAELGLSSDYDAYVSQPSVGVGAANLTLQDILTQKYIALYMNAEAWSDWRRKGIPNLTPITGSMIPTRLPYPETEEFSNTNTPSPADIDIYDKVWWDQ